jgi:release factor glutamine methyltransferase
LVERVEFVEGTLPRDPGEFDLVLANLPYVSEAEWGGLEPEVTEWEPREALLAGPDGLDAIRALLADRGRHFNRQLDEMPTAGRGTIALEIGERQAAAVGELLRGAGFGVVEKRVDLAGIERVVVGRP